MEKYSLPERSRVRLYGISGMGTDERAFNAFKRYFIDPLTYIPWKEPRPGETLKEFADRMISPYIDSHTPIRICIGLSFGGVLGIQALERGMITHLILVSSVKGREELPPVMRLLRTVPVYKVIPASTLKQILVRSGLIPLSLRFENQYKFKEMLDQFSPYYFKWCIDQLVNIPKSKALKNMYHIHGTHDEVFSIKYICSADHIPGGSHLMIITRAKEVSRMVQKIVQKIIEKETNISRV